MYTPWHNFTQTILTIKYLCGSKSNSKSTPCENCICIIHWENNFTYLKIATVFVCFCYLSMVLEIGLWDIGPKMNCGPSNSVGSSKRQYFGKDATVLYQTIKATGANCIGPTVNGLNVGIGLRWSRICWNYIFNVER